MKKGAKIRNLILGIIAVALFQIAFIASINRDTPTEIAADLIETVEDTSRELTRADQPTQNIVDEPTPSDTVSISSAREPRRIKAKAVPADRRGPRQLRPSDGVVSRYEKPLPAASRQLSNRPAFSAYRASSEPATREDFGTRVFYYNARYERPSSPKPAPAKVRKGAPKPDKRSFIAKAIPIIKKPWELMKALVSTF